MVDFDAAEGVPGGRAQGEDYLEVAEFVVGVVRYEGWDALGEDVGGVVGFEDDVVEGIGATRSTGVVF